MEEKPSGERLVQLPKCRGRAREPPACAPLRRTCRGTREGAPGGHSKIARAGEKPCREPGGSLGWCRGGSWGHGGSTGLCPSLGRRAGTARRHGRRPSAAGCLLFSLSFQ